MTAGRLLRPLRPEDAAAVLAVIHAAFAAQEVATVPPSGALRETTGSIGAAIAAGGGAGIEEDGRLVAVVLWKEAEGGLYFGRMGVLPARRGLGLARALIAAAEAEARRRGVGRVHVGVRLSLPGNRRLFEACGYREFRRPFNEAYGAVVSADLEKALAIAA